MSDYKNIFQLISYFQYPFFLAGIGYITYSFYILLSGTSNSSDAPLLEMLFESIAHYWNMAFFMFGLGVSFSTLQDTKKTQNNLSKNVWQDPLKGRVALIFMSFIALFFISLSFVGMFIIQDSILTMLSYGFLAFGIAYVGVLRAAIEMFEYHRLDRPLTNSGNIIHQ